MPSMATHTASKSRQRNLEHSERRFAPEHERADREAFRREARNSVQNESRDRMPRNGMHGHMAGDSDLDFIHQILARQPEVFVGGNSRSWRLEEAAEAEVRRVRKLAGVGSGMGMDAKQLQSRSERLLNVTFEAEARRQRAEQSLAEHFPETKRITIAP